MFCMKLLFVLLVFAFLAQHQCQDYDGVQDSEDGYYWICNSGMEDYDETYSPRMSNGDCSYAYSVTPPPGHMSTNMANLPMFPDISCHPVSDSYIEDPDFNLGAELKRRFHECVHQQYNMGTPWPHFDESEIDESRDWSTCPKICMLSEHGLHLMEQDWPFMEEAQKYHRRFLFKNESWGLQDYLGEELAVKLATKINVECQEKLSKIFEIERSCKDPVALELYDCVNNAVAC